MISIGVVSLIFFLLVCAVLQIVLPSMVINALNNEDTQKALNYLIVMMVFNALGIILTFVFLYIIRNVKNTAWMGLLMIPFAFNFAFSIQAYIILNDKQDTLSLMFSWFSWFGTPKNKSEKINKTKVVTIYSLILGIIFSIILFIVLFFIAKVISQSYQTQPRFLFDEPQYQLQQPQSYQPPRSYQQPQSYQPQPQSYQPQYPSQGTNFNRQEYMQQLPIRRY